MRRNQPLFLKVSVGMGLAAAAVTAGVRATPEPHRPEPVATPPQGIPALGGGRLGAAVAVGVPVVLPPVPEPRLVTPVADAPAPEFRAVPDVGFRSSPGDSSVRDDDPPLFRQTAERVRPDPVVPPERSGRHRSAVSAPRSAATGGIEGDGRPVAARSGASGHARTGSGRRIAVPGRDGRRAGRAPAELPRPRPSAGGTRSPRTDGVEAAWFTAAPSVVDPDRSPVDPGGVRATGRHAWGTDDVEDGATAGRGGRHVRPIGGRHLAGARSSTLAPVSGLE